MKRSKGIGVVILLAFMLCLVSACSIVRPEYLAESALIPKQSPAIDAETPVFVEPSHAITEEAGSSPVASIQPSTSAEDVDPIDDTLEVGYFYSFLTDQQKEYYRNIRNAFDHNLPEFSLCVSSRYDFDVAFYSMRSDYAQYGWLGILPYSYSFVNQQNEIYAQFELTDDQYISKLALLEDEADSIISLIPQNASEYETIKLFYEWLAKNITYERVKPDQLLLSAFKERKTLCAGYAVAFQYLCNRVGIQCLLVDGMADNGQTPPEGHTWNMVRINGEYYWVDATWGDAGDEVSYYFLCTTDEFLFPTHYEIYPFSFGTENKTYTVEREICSDETLLYSKQFGLFYDAYIQDNIYEDITAFLKEGKGNDVVVQFRIHDDVTRFIDELLPHLLQKIQERGLEDYHSYRTLYYERDGYIQIVFD